MSVIIKVAGVVAIVDGLRWSCSNKNLEHMLGRVEYDNGDAGNDPDLRVARLAIQQFNGELVKHDPPQGLQSRIYESAGVLFRYCPVCREFTIAHKQPRPGEVTQCGKCGQSSQPQAPPVIAPTQDAATHAPGGIGFQTTQVLPAQMQQSAPAGQVIQTNVMFTAATPAGDPGPQDAGEWRMRTIMYWIVLCLSLMATLLPVRDMFAGAIGEGGGLNKVYFILFLVLLLPTCALIIRLRKLYVNYPHALVPWYIPAIIIAVIAVFVVFV